MDDPPKARGCPCGQACPRMGEAGDARAPRKGVAGTWLEGNDDRASGSPATRALNRLPGQAPKRRNVG